ncbi:hypothetical protein [Streptomyces sp. NRRL B-24484]|uniref:hypothetical protein n=1 Tax=Streptomyces sp. NRRL B-24484 TaxID=1463833 RepID=UPI000ACBE470|nr:hypothetical protein [Streptomyces sp. NRRL B-24484]
MSEGLASIRAALADWHLLATAGQVAADATLVAAELLASAAQHADGQVSMPPQVVAHFNYRAE